MDPVTFVRSQPDRAMAILAALGGLVLLVVGWIGVSGQGIIAGQIPYVVSCGLGGLVAIAIASTLWISADLRDEWRKMDAIEAAIFAQTEALRTLQGKQGLDDDKAVNRPAALPCAEEVAAYVTDALVRPEPPSIAVAGRRTRPVAIPQTTRRGA